VNLSDLIEVETNLKLAFLKSFSYNKVFNNERISNAFPDEDFCIYKDFPFNQLVYSYQHCARQDMKKMKILNSELSCTYLWLTQYSNVYIQFENKISDEFASFSIIMESDSYKFISQCNFKQRLDFCNKSHFRVKDIFGINDY